MMPVNSSDLSGYGFLIGFSILFIFQIYMIFTNVVYCVNIRIKMTGKLTSLLKNLWSNCHVSKILLSKIFVITPQSIL
jgi:hypothetical protein